MNNLVSHINLISKNEFDKLYESYPLNLAQMTLDDAECDRQIVYTKAKVDERLKEICGEHFVPCEDRYSV